MKNANVNLVPLINEAREWFITENQRAFKYGATLEFGTLDEHFDSDGEIISRKTIEDSLDCPENESYIIMCDGVPSGGLILKINKETLRHQLEILFTLPELHSRGIGYGAWCAVEELHPEAVSFETCTPYFEKRNIHFYINKCGFHVVEFFCEYHIDANCQEPTAHDSSDEGPDEMFRFLKVMK